MVGMDVECAALSVVISAAGGGPAVSGIVEETPFNMPIRALFSEMGFEFDGVKWLLPKSIVIGIPSHIAMTTTGVDS